MRALPRSILLGLFVATPAAQYGTPGVRPASEEGRLALAAIEVPPGLACDLFAAEPMLANPVCLYVGSAGELYVGETFRHHAGVTDIRQHMDWLDEDVAARTVADRLRMIRAHEGENYDPGYGVEQERIRLIRDTDGDGVADRATVFADGFDDHAAGIGAGLLAHEGDLYYTCIPDLWRLRDTDGDDVHDEREVLSTGYGVHVALLGHDLHGLRIGPDRRLYFSCGDRGFHVETEDAVIAHPETGAVLRCELDGSGLEVVHTGLRNPQELVFDEWGNLFTGDNNSDGGDAARWVNVVEGADSGWRYAYQWIGEPVSRGPWNDERLWLPAFEGQAAYVLPPIANVADGPSGLTYHPGTGLTPEYAKHYFLCDFLGDPAFSGIRSFTTEPDGASWRMGEPKRFLWNTLATDCDFGPDGKLYFTDWVEGWNRTGKGRVYRAFAAAPDPESAALVEETRQRLAAGFEGLAPAEIEPWLEHADQRVRQAAQFALVDAGAEGHGLLFERAARATSADSPERERLARWHALQGLGIVARTAPELAAPVASALAALLEDADPEVRAQSVRLLGDLRLDVEEAAVRERLADESARVQAFAAIAAGRLRLRSGATVEALAQLLRAAGERDRTLRHAGVMGLLGCADGESIETLATSEDRHLRMAACLVLRRQADPAIVRFLADEDPWIVLEAARAIHDLPIAPAFEALAALPLAGEGTSAALARRVLNAARRTQDAERLAALALDRGLAPAFRREALEILAAWHEAAPRDRVTNAPRPYAPAPPESAARVCAPLLDGIEAELGAAEAAMQGAEAAGMLLPPLTRLVARLEVREAIPVLRAWCETPALGAPARRASLAALEALAAPELAALVRSGLQDPDGEFRAAALEALERLAPGEALPGLTTILARGELAERRAALRILGRAPSVRAGALLEEEVQRLVEGLYPAELVLDLELAVEASAHERARSRIAPWLARRTALDAELGPWLGALYGGDAARGRTVFERVDLSCVRCHRSEGGDATALRVGPDLAGVAGRLDRLQMMASILVPNRRTTLGYAGTVFFLRDGGVVTGRVVEEEPDRIAVLDAEGDVIEVRPADVEERRADLSAMPDGLGLSLTKGELRDLLAYLATL